MVPSVALVSRNRLLLSGVANALGGEQGMLAADVPSDVPSDYEGVVLVDLATSEDTEAFVDWIAAPGAVPMPVVAMVTGELTAELRPHFAEGRFSVVGSSVSPGGLQQTIHAAHAGLIVLDPALMPFAIDQGEGTKGDEALGTGVEPDAWQHLSPREHAVLELIARGMTNKQIGMELDIMDGTVRVHVREVLRKLDVTNRTQAALAFVNAGPGENGG